MAYRRARWGGLVLGAAVLALAPRPALAQPAPGAAPGTADRTATALPYGPMQVPLDELPPDVRPRAREVLERPTLRVRGPAEVFACQPALYYWLLDHPDLAVRLWRCLGARCADIQAEGGDRFGWFDPQGGTVHWSTVLRKPGQRIWYAEGVVRPGVLLPAVPVRAVVVLQHAERGEGGRTALRHQIELVLHTDSHAASLAARLLGASAPRVAEQYVAEIGMFYGVLAWYLGQHPDQAGPLFAQLQRPPSTDAPLFRPGKPNQKAETTKPRD